VLAAPAESGAPDRVVSGVAKSKIGAGYFTALSVPMVQGREFDARDQRFEPDKSRALPVVLNETAVRSFFGTRDPLGRRISDASASYQVVGVIKDLSAPESESAGVAVSALPVIYMPLTKTDFAHPPVGGMVVMVRANSGTDAMTGVRRELAAIDPNLPIFNVRSLAEEVHQTAAWPRMHAIIYGAIGAFGMVLAAIGLAGVTAYSVARRRREIGIRMALGARKGQVLRLVLREGGGLVATGTVLGFAGAFGLSRLLAAASSIFGPEIAAGAHDLRLIFGAPLLLAGLAMLACYVPARKSTKIDPLVALRQE
jgi:ABC-type antimicrobial peptide transport system permease subunit